MARFAVKVTMSTAANPNHPSVHTAAPVASSGESGDVYISYDSTKVTGARQLLSGLNAAFQQVINGNFTAGS